jgi:bifunctional UDP-N-acetylglucosamine pyrophosphorylase/glucosamine-1-phosphate N-acetyltransferase
MNTNVVILAAGLGTRMKSKRAKVLHRAGGLSLIEHVVNAALAITPPDRITVVVGHQADEVIATLEPAGVRFVKQTEQKGTGHAVMACRRELEGASDLVAVVYGDCPLLSSKTLDRLMEAQTRSDAAVTLITTRLEDPTGYGRVVLDQSGNVRAIVEQKAATPEQLAIRTINSGIYCFRADLLWKHIGGIQPNNPAREYYLTDLAEILNREGHTVAALEIDDSQELLGINTRMELAEVDRILRDRKTRELMAEGVTIEKPETVIIDGPVRIGIDTVIQAFTRITGNTIIGQDCRIGGCSVIANSSLADGVMVAPFTTIADSQIDAGAQVGPYARLRMGAHVENDVHIGNFVELKKTRIGAGAKASHLAYLGDADIGAGVNIGAGTITCNYDGVKKHPTKIGERAFVGSNSTLVAPVEIGAGSYVGAGSVITEPVPSEALALGRGRQVIKDGWVQKRRARAK